jgi:isoleucyl-tRNA synthetase
MKTISIEEYNEACKKTVMRYTDVWNDLTEKWAIGLIWKIRM